ASLNPAVATALTTPDEDPYATMAGLFGWDTAELMWVQRTLPADGDVEFALKAVELFRLAERLGAPPSRLGHLTGEPVNTLKRDALLSAVLSRGEGDSTDLFERLLIDVEMGGLGLTTRVREAIAAVQLYLHRCLLDLEQVGEADRERLRRWWGWMRNYRVWEANRRVFLYPENYLRPELRGTKTPGFVALENELMQSGVTAATAQRAYKRYLDEYTEVSRLAIAGGYVEATGDGARSLVLFGRTRTEPRRFYHRDALFRDGDRLSASWSPWHEVDVRIDAERVHPVRAFGRTFVFWAGVEALQPSQGSAVVAVRSTGESTQEVSSPPVWRQVKIYYSFLNLNGEWMPAQVLATGAPRIDPITTVTLTVRTGPLPDTEHDAIIVAYSSMTVTGPVGAQFGLTPELYAVPIEGVVIPPPAGDVTTIFHEDEEVDPASVIWFDRPAGFDRGSWFSVDLKGGSFLCRPMVPPPGEIPADQQIRGNQDGLPSWDRIDAAVELPNGNRLIWDNVGNQYAMLVRGRDRVERIQQIDHVWGFTEAAPPPQPGGPTTVVIGGQTVIVAPPPVLPFPIATQPSPGWSDNPLNQDGDPSGAWTPLPVMPAQPTGTGWRTVDAAWMEGEHLFVASGTRLARYSLDAQGNPAGVMDEADGYPMTIPRPITGVIGGYALRSGSYARVGEWIFRPLRGEWANLPATIRGIMESRDGLYIFRSPTYLFYRDDAGIPYPLTGLPHDIVRLTSSTAAQLNRRLLSGGVAALLDTTTQETDELPALDTDTSDATTIQVKQTRVVKEWLPGRSHLDFSSANGTYYWEIFFHAPLLIAQALNAAQRFEEARTWFEHVFDPTRSDQYWRFLPFLGADPGALAEALRLREDSGLDGAVALLESLVPVFRGEGELSWADRQALAELPDLAAGRDPSVGEDLAVAAGLARAYDLAGDRQALLHAYLEDPFDPHTIAALRPVAYRRAVVAGYVDNLLDWGDLLFRQYTMESVDEARMLYLLAHDLLGRRPGDLGALPAAAALPFTGLDPELTEGDALGGLVRAHAGAVDPYFHIPVNPSLGGYWDLVADRLTKIRASLDILGVARPLPLFEPPIDPAALVTRAAADGAAVPYGETVAAEVPHYRFTTVLRRAQELADRVRDFSGLLLDTLERRDSEALGLLADEHEAVLLQMTRAVRQAQVVMAEENVTALRAGLTAAENRVAAYEAMIAAGPSALQQAQIGLMASAAAAHFTASGLKIGAAIAHGVPQVLLGPFILGTMYGGDQVGDALAEGAEVAESLGEGLQVLGEVLGVRAEHERSEQDWRLQADTARGEVAQIAAQVVGGEAGVISARRELEILERQIGQQQAVSAFLRGKFTGGELYQWMASRMAELSFQAYGTAHDLAKAAERAFEFERGTPAPAIRPAAWDSRRAGLLAGQTLGADLDRLARAYADSDGRRLEITRRASLLEVDPVALLTLVRTGSCEFTLSEEFFDHDFPGLYRRQLRAMALSFETADGQTLTPNALLTQLSHRTLLAPDPRAAQWLLSPQGPAPAQVRSDWRAGQRIALSHVAQGWENNGLFELRYDDERYLPFEGTGAISTWRLELPGLRSADRPAGLHDVVLTVRYTAEHGGDTFAAAVKGMLKPYGAAVCLDVPAAFPDAWASPGSTLTLPLTPAHLPDLHGRQITGLYAVYDGDARLTLDGTALPDGRLVPTPGLSLGAAGLRLGWSGERASLRGLRLVLTYRAGLR
ncbi:MAG: hypothetical protein HOV86_23715, partial [Thermoactinospora sp.]|nr:hypothetical protein [Thermoactinospora sp.]